MINISKIKDAKFFKKTIELIDVLVKNTPRFVVISTIIIIIVNLANLPTAVVKVYESVDNFVFPEKRKIKLAEEQVARFRPNINLEWYEDLLKVKPMFVNKYKSKSKITKEDSAELINVDVNCQENIYLTEYYWLKIIKSDENIVYTAVISRDKRFQPTVLVDKIGETYFTNSERELKIKYISSSKYVEYYETYYGGNPTLYQDIFIGSSASGFNYIQDIPDFFEDSPKFDNEGFLDLEKLSLENKQILDKFRKKGRYNTVGFSSGLGICIDNSNIGPNYFLTRFVNF